ncbi:uncharacterized protein K02A2.6-like [Topomyia yanbarensis]|uniref:uncharacterized protein K02A2.6-like n=1 Tax=Topomyia yanbarensis TaxID=2498891 RepID=UPI00273CDCCD|nr:uncharacterized protein K02A2.6-like [Topomyia yanbarensis]
MANEDFSFEQKAISSLGAVIKPPKPLLIDENMALKWKQWWRQFHWYAVATELDSKQPHVQAAMLLSCIGEDCIRVMDTFGLTEAQERDINILRERFNAYFVPKSCLTYERYVYGKIVQHPGEQFDTFLTRVREQAKKCAFSVLSDSMVKDKIISGTVHTKLIPQLLNDDLDLQKTIDICRNHEQSVKQTQVMLEKSSAEVDSLEQKKFEKRSTINEEAFWCNRCGYKHRQKSCPAFNKVCVKCKRKGHFAERCFGLGGSEKRCNNYVRTVSCEKDENETEELLVEELYIGAVNDDDENSDDVWFESVQINGKNVRLKLDTGAACNVLPYSIFCMLGGRLMPSPTKRLVSYSNHKLEVKGEAVLPVIVKGRPDTAVFKIVDGDVAAILGRKTCVRLNLVAKVEQLSMDKSLFSGLGCVNGFEYDIDLAENPTFQYNPPRRIPHSLRDQVKAELDGMEELGVIEKISEPTPVLNSMVIVRQKGKLRICIDPSQVNKNILRRVHPLSTIEEISSRICNSKWFTVLDLRKGFWQIPVTERTKKYLAFGTPWGRYTCKRLPFGLASAPEVFQKLMNTVLDGLQGVESSMDDILIHAATIDKLNEITKEVLRRLEAAGLKLNREKCVFAKPSLKFLGHIVSQEGLKADPDKLAAIERIKRPENKVQLQRVLGMITYLGKFIENLSAITEPLRQLLIKNVEWLWGEEQEKSFQKIKNLMQSPPVLAFYDINADITLSVDASSKALGAVLLQNGKPVAYASKSLTSAQENYPPIEKEAAAIRFACNRFHEYVYGKNLIIETDHKPLESISKKTLDRAPPRLKRILLDVSQYAPRIVYKKGTEIPIPDILSRDVDNCLEKETFDELEVHVVLQMSKIARSEITEETSQDPELSQLISTIMNGWPHNRLEVPEIIRKYWNFRDELSVYEGLVFRAHQILVPNTLRQKMLLSIHAGHAGTQGSIRRAKQMLFWIGMYNDITRMVENCSVCEKHQRSTTKHDILGNEIPTLPFEIVGSDLFHFQGRDYILIADSYSGYFDFVELRETSSKSVMVELKRWFSMFGIPRILYTDNGPQYSSLEFNNFSKKWTFDHVTSSPHFPRSNGLSERFVQTAKNLLRRCTDDGSDVQLALLMRRNTPRDQQLLSPNQRLMGRVLRTTLPTTKKVLQPKLVKDVSENLRQLRDKQKTYADRGTSKAPEFVEGQNVVVQNTKSHLWEKGTINRKLDQPRSYIVKFSNNRHLRRNVRDIKASKTNPLVHEDGDSCTTYVPRQSEQSETTTRNNQTNSDEGDDGEIAVQPSTEEFVRTRSGREVRMRRDSRFEYY